MPETRVTFEGLAGWELILWYALAALSTAIFFWGAGLLIRKYWAGRHLRAADDARSSFLKAGMSVLSQSDLFKRHTAAGAGHFLSFYGFIALFIGTVVLAVNDDVTRRLFGFEFWHGGFYLIYSLILDVFGAGFLIGLTVMGVLRGLQRPFRLNYARVDKIPRAFDRRRYLIGDWIFLAALVFLTLTGFLLEGLRIAETNPAFEIWSPVGWLTAQAMRAAGVNGHAAAQAHHSLWWIHGIAALAFVSVIPFTKAVHMLGAPANLAVRDDRAGKRLPAAIPSDKHSGYTTITDFSWQHLISLDACTKCGRCHEVCPATASGYPLSPRDLILDLREAAEGSLGIRAAMHVQPLYKKETPLVADVLQADTIWSCMQCMACVESCPVGIEHVPIINQLRRPLFETGKIDPMLQGTLERIYNTGNSFGEPRRRRSQWIKELGFEVKDIREEPAEILWFLGDYASFDPRNQRVTRALARLLHDAGVDFGILHEAERTAGCDVRRAGEESLWTSLAEQNIATIKACRFERILSTDPHTFHTLKNEYPALGGAWTIRHHTELLLELLQTRKLNPVRRLGSRVTYHDPCMLGRYNGVYDAPRRVLEELGLQLIEMPRNRANSFCCGAGGGRIWMTELAATGSRRPSEQRIDEAVALGGIDYFVVACPKDVTMYEDAIKTSGHQREIHLRELTELVAEAVSV